MNGAPQWQRYLCPAVQCLAYGCDKSVHSQTYRTLLGAFSKRCLILAEKMSLAAVG